MKKRSVTPSILNVEPADRVAMVTQLISQGIDWVHYDVMDGKFVPNTAIEFAELENINKLCPQHFKDVHLMIENPLQQLEKYKDVADIITFHFEATDEDELFDFVQKQKHNLNLGLAIKPNTSVTSIERYLPYLALVLVMSVEPGAGGQKFIETTYEKVKALKLLRLKHQHNFLIQVDGGINNVTGPLTFKAGADACVAGTFLIKEPTKERIASILYGKK
ncbi:ribulose-phosphate 3-epimerase [Mycoplasmopsis columbinasalis]|uniref:D-ribulose-5-phosphate 3 epimerase n=1 Tax=Mycoplasmopsis columbinasalis TaxID=114880 RepID=A0A449BA00_9BACT|nr:ribulose-phosphate 3-epimerase [Mycoplasmopsis columbinasalis]VEU77985.1 d-ribulose-5-phosphate 3 epimerase [Mycoplasmopsis columbinasalis]